MDMEGVRCWYGILEGKELAKKTPLQWSIFRDNFIPEEGFQSGLDEEIFDIASNAPNSSDSVMVKPLQDLRGNVVATVLESISIKPRYSIYQSSIESIIQLAQDLAIDSKISGEVPKDNQDRRSDIPNSHRNTPTPLVSSIENKSRVDVMETAPQAPLKRNPFVSAKEQFGKEGGKLNAATEKGGQLSSLPQKRSRLNPAASATSGQEGEEPLPEGLQHFDRHMLNRLESEILSQKSENAISFSDIAGLEFAKKCVQELICWPMLRPDIFTGLRALPKGVLLFGPPGTGKTLIGKAIAQQTGATFFSISASSLTSKWVGESETAVRALFALAVHHQPSVVFIDEVDSLLTQRSSEESEASRRIKTEFLVQLDGASTCVDAKVVVIGATNRPDELDEAARRRFVKRLYIPLPDREGRSQLIRRLLLQDESVVKCNLSESDIESIVDRTGGFSGADIRFLCTEAAMGPVRELAFTSGFAELDKIVATEVPPIAPHHFEEALSVLSASVSQADLEKYIAWNGTFGTYRRME